MNDIDPETGSNHEIAFGLADEHRDLVQSWIDKGASLNDILYVLGISFASTLGQCGAPRSKVEQLHGDILDWINSTETMREAVQPQNRAQRRAANKATKH